MDKGTILSIVCAIATIVYCHIRSRPERRLAGAVNALRSQVVRHDEHMGNLTQGLAQLVPSDARPTAVQGSRPRSPPMAPMPPVEPASMPLAGPRMRVDIRRTAFPSERAIALPYNDPETEPLTVDARDVDEREGTMRVAVHDLSRPDFVQVQLPPGRGGERLVWVPRALVLDCPSAASPVAARAPVGAEGDRGTVVPGDPIPESAEEVPSVYEGETEDDRTRIYSGRSQRRATLMGGLGGAGEQKEGASPSRALQVTLVSGMAPASRKV